MEEFKQLKELTEQAMAFGNANVELLRKQGGEDSEKAIKSYMDSVELINKMQKDINDVKGTK